jgi:hypothetical protein
MNNLFVYPRNFIQIKQNFCWKGWTTTPSRCGLNHNSLSAALIPISGISFSDLDHGTQSIGNRGWGDPAFDIADLITHLAFIEVPSSRWVWLLEQYGQVVEDTTIATRIFTYSKIMLIWWLARFTRYLYEIPRSLDQRLSPWPKNILTDLSEKYDCYLKKADQGLLD